MLPLIISMANISQFRITCDGVASNKTAEKKDPFFHLSFDTKRFCLELPTSLSDCSQIY